MAEYEQSGYLDEYPRPFATDEAEGGDPEDSPRGARVTRGRASNARGAASVRKLASARKQAAADESEDDSSEDDEAAQVKKVWIFVHSYPARYPAQPGVRSA